MNATYSVTLHHEYGHEAVGPSFVLPALPYPGLRILRGTEEWEVVQVRLHVRDKNSMAERHNDPHIVDVLVRPSEGMFA